MPNLFEEEDWYQSATLAERAVTLARTGEPAVVNAALAARRLERWRSQAPFQKEEILRRRLAMDGLSLEDFTALLGESRRQVRERFPDAPAWLADLAEAFAAPREGAARLGTEDARRAGVVLVVEPVVIRARERLRVAARRIVESRPDVPFDADAVVEVFFDLLIDTLSRALNRAMVLELHIAARTGRLRGETPRERFGDFLEKLREPDFALGLLRQYPVAARRAVESAERWVSFAFEVLAQLADDWDAIRQVFADGAAPGPLTGVQCGHGGRRTVLFLRFASGFGLVYKSRPLGVDGAFQRLLVWLNHRGADPVLRPLRLMDRGGYGWVELIQDPGCASVEEVRRFYRRQGSYLALFYALAATDFHPENLLAAGEHPLPIDLETLFHPRAGEVGVVPRALLADDAAWDPAPELWLEDGEGELVRFTRKAADLEVEARHRPTLDGRRTDPRDSADAIAEGFESCYRLLVRHREALLAPNGPLAAFGNASARIPVRPARAYSRLLTESFHPYVLQDALDRDRLIDRLWVDVEHRPALERILPHEHRELEQGDVPVFTTFPSSRDLWTSTGERIPDALPETGLESCRRILLQMGDADLARQLQVLRDSREVAHGQGGDGQW